MTETHSSTPQGAESDPWRELRALNDLDLGALAHKTGNESFFMMLRALPVTYDDQRNAYQDQPAGMVGSFVMLAADGARIRRTLPPPPNPELDALCSYLGQPRGRLLEGAQRLVDHNNELRVSRDGWVREAQKTANTLAAVEPAEDALLAVGRALDVVGTGKPWAEIGKAGVAAVALLNTHLKTARQGWADESAAVCRARVELVKSRAELDRLADGFEMGPSTHRHEVAVSTALLLADEATRRGEWAREVAAAHGKSPEEPVWDVVKRVVAEYGEVAKYDPAETVAYVNTLRADLGKSRAEVATLSEQVASLKADLERAYQETRRQKTKIMEQGAELDQFRETCQRLRAHRDAGLTDMVAVRAELEALRDAARTLLPADSTPNPATGWLADVIRSTGSTIADLRAALNKTEAQAQRDRIAARNGRIGTLEAEVESLTAALRSLREQRDGLRASLVQAQDTAAGWMAKYDKVAAEVTDLRERRADCVVAAEDLAAHRLEAVAVPARPCSYEHDTIDGTFHLGFTLRPTGGLAIRLTHDEALELRGWLINASGLPAIEPRERSLRAVSAAVPQVVVNIGAGRTVTAPEPLKTSGLLTYSAEGSGPPAPAADLEPLRRAACALIDAAAALTHPKAA